MSRILASLIPLAFALCPVWSQTPPPAAAPPQQAPPGGRGARPPAPARDPHTAGYVQAKELPDGEIPPVNADGNFIIGATHKPAPEVAVREDVPHGAIVNFTMESTDSKYYPGIASVRQAPGADPVAP